MHRSHNRSTNIDTNKWHGVFFFRSTCKSFNDRNWNHQQMFQSTNHKKRREKKESERETQRLRGKEHHYFQWQILNYIIGFKSVCKWNKKIHEYSKGSWIVHIWKYGNRVLRDLLHVRVNQYEIIINVSHTHTHFSMHWAFVRVVCIQIRICAGNQYLNVIDLDWLAKFQMKCFWHLFFVCVCSNSDNRLIECVEWSFSVCHCSQHISINTLWLRLTFNGAY